MNLLTAEHITKSYTDRMLFEDAVLGIQEGDKIGLIGINGTGKSTLLRILAGQEEPDSGTVTKGGQVQIGYLPQNPVFDSERTVLENVLAGKAVNEEGWNLEGEARAMLARFGILEADGSPARLSGGERKRAALVRVLLEEKEREWQRVRGQLEAAASLYLLILDEPTNHLDSEMSEWLEEYLKKSKAALLMITHDRYFLDQVTNRIWELDQGRIYGYTGGYTRFLELKAARAESELATERKKASLYRQDLEWMLRGARARSTKQKAHIARFEELKGRERPREERLVELGSVSSRLGRSIVEIRGLAKRYGEKELFRDFDYTFVKQERLGIIGHNGCGKTTLLRILLGQEQPDKGTIEIGQTVKIGYFSQETGELNPKQRVLDSVQEIAEYVETSEGLVSATKLLERFLFEGALQYALIEKLSGGEKRRLALLHVLIQAPNLLILDEPTNDLDIQTLSILEDYLDSFAGIVVTVSHDRYFLDRVVNRILAFEEGTIRQYEGGYSDYLAKRQEEQESGNGTQGQSKKSKAPRGAREDNKIQKKAGSNGSGKQDSGGEEAINRNNWKERQNPPERKKLKFTYQEQREYETIDAVIAGLEERIGALEQEMAEYASSYVKLKELSEEKERLEAELAERMDRWVYLTELAEQIEKQKEGD